MLPKLVNRTEYDFAELNVTEFGVARLNLVHIQRN